MAEIVGRTVEVMIALVLGVLVVLLLLGAGLYLCWETMVRDWRKGKGRGLREEEEGRE